MTALLATWLLLLTVQAGEPAPGRPELEAAPSADSVFVGQPFWVDLTVRGLEGQVELEIAELPDTGVVTGVAAPSIGPRVEDRWSARLAVAAWRPGVVQLAPLQVRLATPVAATVLTTPPLTVQVVSVLPEDARIDTLAWRPPADVAGSNWSLTELLTAAGALIVILAAGLLYARRRRSAPPPGLPARTPRERALGVLDWLASSGLVATGELRAFYSILAQVVRSFLAETEAAWGLDLTTGELVAAVSGDGVARRQLEVLHDLLRVADGVKFARWRPSSREAAAALERTREWIEAFQRQMSPPAVEADGVGDHDVGAGVEAAGGDDDV